MSTNAQGFWTINSLVTDYISKINGVALTTPTKVIDYRLVDSNYIVVKDDNEDDVLIVTSIEPIELTMAASGVDYPAIGEPIEYFIGQKPRRPK